MMRRNWSLWGITLVALFGALTPHRASALTLPGGILAHYSLSGQGITASGRMALDEKFLPGYSGPVWQILEIDGTFADSVSGVSGIVTDLIAGSDYTNLPSRTNHDSFPATGKPYPPASYDNLLYPRGDSPVDCLPYYNYTGGPIDMYGILFKVSLTGGQTWLVNVWSNGDLNDPANPLGVDFGTAVGPLGVDGLGQPEWHVSRYLGDGNDYQTDPTKYQGSGITFSYSTPEPSSCILAASGIAILGLRSLRRRARQAA
jgi:hypothetical protein